MGIREPSTINVQKQQRASWRVAAFLMKVKRGLTDVGVSANFIEEKWEIVQLKIELKPHSCTQIRCIKLYFSLFFLQGSEFGAEV